MESTTFLRILAVLLVYPGTVDPGTDATADVYFDFTFIHSLHSYFTGFTANPARYRVIVFIIYSTGEFSDFCSFIKYITGAARLYKIYISDRNLTQGRGGGQVVS